MRKISIKLFCTALCFAFLISAFAGCGGGASNETSESSQQTATAQTTQPTQTENAKFDLASLPKVELIIAQPDVDFDNVTGMKEDRILNYLQDKLKVKFKFITSSEYQTKINLMVSTGETLDFVSDLYKTAFTTKLYEEGMLLNMKDLVFNNPERYPVLYKAFNDPLYKYINETKFGNADNYCGIYMGGYIINSGGSGLMINGNMLKETGLAVPKTIDEVINFMRAIKKIKPDVIPFSTNLTKGTGYGLISNQLFKPYGVSLVDLVNENGVYKENFTSEDAKQAWIMVQGLYKEGLLDKEMVTRDVQWFEGIYTDKVAVSGINSTSLGQFDETFIEYLKSHPNAKPGVDLLSAGPFTGPKGDTTLNYNPYDFGKCTSFIIKSSKYPERVLDLVNYLMSNEGMNLKFWGVEGIHYTGKANGKLITSGDEVGWIKAEYQKEAMIYKKNYTIRQEWKPFSYVGPIGYGGYSVEASDNLLEALKNFACIINMSYIQNDEVGKYSLETTKLFDSKTTILPMYMKDVVLTGDAQTRNKTLGDIRNKWYTAFLVGEKDVSSNWDSFVKELKDAGLDQYIADYNSVYANAKTTYEKYIK